MNESCHVRLGTLDLLKCIPLGTTPQSTIIHFVHKDHFLRKGEYRHPALNDDQFPSKRKPRRISLWGLI